MRENLEKCGACGRHAPECAHGFDDHCPHLDEIAKKEFKPCFLCCAIFVTTIGIVIWAVGAAFKIW